MIIILLPFEFNAYVFVSREDIRESFIHNLKFLLEFIERGTISQFKKLNNASIAFGSEFLCSFNFEFGISEGYQIYNRALFEEILFLPQLLKS